MTIHRYAALGVQAADIKYSTRTDGKGAKSVQAYREDLLELPRNGWSLLGLGQSLKAQGKPEADALLFNQFPAVWKDADTAIETSCPVFSQL